MTAFLPGAPSPYPVHISADPVADRPSRGLWLIKWLLVIPHLFLLFFLWLAFFVLSVVAFFAILFTGRYPRTIFDFNVGVMRWSWRVSYYSYGALGTDRYPPFSLHDDPSYPAHLEVDYPEQLSRGLALVKWWLLAIPHYLILAVITGAGARVARDTAGAEWAWEGGLLALLVLIAGVALLFTARYPQGLYNLVLGLNRWSLRVAGYASLMTDQYPPFRLDQGGQHDPSQPTEPRAVTSRWTPGRVITVALGSLALMIGPTVIAGGAAMLAWDEGDFYTSPTRTVETSGYAVTTDELLLEGSGLDQGLGEVRVRAESVDGEEIFLGIGPSEDVAEYLSGVSHTELLGRIAGGRQQHSGGPPATAAQDADFWVASAAGPGRQSVEVEAQEGSWAVVVMPTDGNPGLAVRADVGATLPWLAPTARALIPIGALLMLGGAVAIGLAIRSASVTRRP